MREHCATNRPVPRGDLETQMESLCELVGYGHCGPPTLHRLHLFAPSRSSVLFRLFRNLATLVVAELRRDDALDAHEVFFLARGIELHTLRIAAEHGDALRRGAYQGAGVGDQHHLVLFRHQYGADHRAVAFAGLYRNHALTAAAVQRIFAELGALAVAVFGGGEHGVAFLRDNQRNHALAFAERDTAHAARGAAHRPHMGIVETHTFAGAAAQQHVAVAGGDGDTDQMIVFAQFERDDAAGARPREFGQRRFLHRAAGGRHEDEFVFFIFADRQNGGDALAFFQRQQIDDGFASRIAAGLRQLVDFFPIHLAAIGKTQNGVVGAGDQQPIDEDLFLHRGRRFAGAAAFLGAVFGERLGFGITAVRQRHHHVFFGDQIFEAEVLMREHDLGTARITVLRLDRQQLFADHLQQAVWGGENIQQLADADQDFLVLVDDLFLLEAGEGMQAQIEDGLGLSVGQTIAAIDETEFHREILGPRGRGSGTRQHLDDEARRPGLRHQALFRRRGIRRGLDQRDDGVDVGQRHRQPFQDMGALARLAEFEHRAPRDHFAAVADECFQYLLEIKQARLAVHHHDHVDAEHALHLGVLIEIVEHHFRHFTAAQFNEHAHAVLIGLVAELGDALDAFFLHELGDLLEQTRLVHLVRQLGDDDGLATLGVFFDMRARPYVDAAAAGVIGLVNAARAVDDGGGRKIRAGNQLHERRDIDGRVVDHRQAAVDHFIEIVGRHGGGEADGNTGGTVDQQIGDLGREYRRLPLRFVVVRREIDRFLVEIGQQIVGDVFFVHLSVTN